MIVTVVVVFGDVQRQAPAGTREWNGSQRRASSCVRRDVPSARAARSAYRCEIDLSPGTRTRPRTWRAGPTTVEAEPSTELILVYARHGRATDGILSTVHTSRCRRIPVTSSISSSRACLRCWTASRWSATTSGAASASTTTTGIGWAWRFESRSSTPSSTATGTTRPNTCTWTSRRRSTACPQISIRVRDEGEGFDPDGIADPLAPENLLKASGRGIFLIQELHGPRAGPARSRGRDGNPDDQARAGRRPRQFFLQRLSCPVIRCFSPPPSRPSSAPEPRRWSGLAAAFASTRRARSIW